jgi:hypothetical protein
VVDQSRPSAGVGAQLPLAELEAVGHFDEAPADRGEARIVPHGGEGRRQEAGKQLHVAIDEQQELPARELPPEVPAAPQRRSAGFASCTIWTGKKRAISTLRSVEIESARMISAS